MLLETHSCGVFFPLMVVVLTFTYLFQQLMNAIAMVHKMQRLALTNNTSSMDVDEAQRCDTIQEETEEGDEGIALWTLIAV